jgi:hypothetical protein
MLFLSISHSRHLFLLFKMESTIDSQGIDSQSRTREILAIVCCMAILSSTIVALRLFTRLKILKACGLDDWLMVAAQVPQHVHSVPICHN